MQDFSYDVPLFGGTMNRSIRVNALDAVFAHHCIVCNGTLAGQVVCLGTPYSCIIHRYCLHNMNYTRGWPHRYPANYYADASMASEATRGEPNQFINN